MLALNPNIKNLYFQHQWSHEKYLAGMKQLGQVISDSIGLEACIIS
jgi:hypothetical protein